MANFDGNIRIGITADGAGFSAGIRKLLGALGGVAAAVGIAFGVRAIVDFNQAAIDASNEIKSAYIGLQSIVEGQGKSFSAAKEFIQAYIADGLVPASDAVTAYKNLLMRGYSTEQIEKTMIALKNSSAFGRSAALTMGEAVRSATEGLRNENSILVDNSGITKNVSMMWKDYAKSIGVGVESLTKAQKIIAETNGIVEETRFQMGDAEKVAGTYAGQISALGVAFKNFKVAFGDFIIPILTQIIPIIKTALVWLTAIFTELAQFMNFLFGIEASAGASAAGLDQAAAAADNLGDSIEGVGKKAKGSLAAFDQLNVLSSGADAGGGGAGESPISLPPIDTEPVTGPLDLLKAKFEDWKKNLLGFFQPAIDAFNRLVVALTPLGMTIWAGLQWAWDNVLVPFATWAVTEVLPDFLDLLAAMATALNLALIAAQPILQWLWDNWLKPLADWTGKAITDGLEWLTKWINENPQLFVQFLIVLGLIAAAFAFVGVVIGVLVPIISGIVSLFVFLSGVAGFLGIGLGALIAVILAAAATFMIFVNAVITIIATFALLGVAAALAWKWIQDTWKNVADWFVEKVLEPLGEAFEPAWDFIVILAQDAWALISFAWDGVSEWFTSNVIDPVKRTFTNLWTSIQISAQLGLIWLSAVWRPIGDWFSQNVTDPLKRIFDTSLAYIGAAWERTFDGVSLYIKGIFNNIIGLINGLLSAATDGLNSLIDSLNNMGSVVPGWITIPSLTAPNIPLLATGAVIPPNAPFLAQLGDQRSGRNLEAPEGLIRQIIREEMGGGGQEITINFSGDLSALVRELAPYVERETTRKGLSLVTVSG